MTKRGARRSGLALALLLLAVILAATVYFCNKIQEKTAPQAVFLDVGEGSATLLLTADATVLIDSGPESEQERLCARLRVLGVKEIDLLVITHPDEDHIGGADGILDAFTVREIWTNGEIAETDSYDACLRAAEHVLMRVVSCGETRTLGDLTLEVLSPDSDSNASGNENGLVLRATVGETVLLLMGDAGTSTEQALLTRFGADGLQADILLAGHHGSNGACGADFLTAVSPREIVISCGAGNSYGHPDARALERMRAVCSTIRRTDTEGDVRILLAS